MKTSKRRQGLIAIAALGALASIPIVQAATGRTASAADPVPGDGTTQTTAGASCWGIKQAIPASTDGIYWVYNSSMDRPLQVHCDMTTNGGGWVLVARGRQGWTFDPTGQGSPATLRNVTDGPDAFAPAALDTPTITSLLGGQAVNTLPDGIRLERATNTTGTTRQDYRLYPQSSKWNWALDAGQLLQKVVVDGTTYQGSNTRDTSVSVAGQTTNGLNSIQGTRRLFTYPWTSHDRQRGFSFGSSVSGGSNSADNFLWTYANEGRPIPFTRVWIRPQIANGAAGFTPLPAEGFTAAPKPANFSNRPEFAPFGVVGLDHTNETRIEPWNTSVLAVEAHGDRVYVGGRFTDVEQNGGATTAQAYLAAFDLQGNWISSFAPELDGRVWDIAFTDDGKMILAGDFTSVNGEPETNGMAAIDPTTGASITTWKANAIRSDGTRSYVRTLDVHDGVIYAAGKFNRVKAGTWNEIKVTNAVSLSADNGNPRSWRPQPSGSVVRLDVSDDGSRVLLSGYFTAVNGDTNQGYFAVTEAANGAILAGQGPWLPSIGTRNKYQQDVLDLGDGRMLVGGSEHDFQLWDSGRTQLLDSAITKQGGDTQVIDRLAGKVFMGCHCADWLYQGTNNWSSPTGFRSVDRINLIGAWDPVTFEYDTSWYPSGLHGEYGEGVWDTTLDANGCLWVGGDLKRGSWSGNASTDYLGGFGRFCALDSTPPTAPTGLSATASGGAVNLSWGPSTDDVNTPSYEIWRDDRVIATTWGTSYSDANVTGTHRYTVRAVDGRGNVSASPAPIAVNGPAPVISTAKAFGTSWSYLDDGTDQGTAWREAGFDDSGWAAGNGILGWGKSTVVTTIGGSLRPQTAYFRSTFDVEDPAQVRILDLGVKQATGSVVYVNGIEVGRINMPTGPITAATTAAGWISGEVENQTNKILVPASLLVPGENTVAVELHNMRTGSNRSFFDLEATLYGAGGDDQAPTAPTLSATAGSGTADLAWTAATDDVAVGGYKIIRDGQPIAIAAPVATSFVDTVDTSQPHDYQVVAFDSSGNTTDSNTVALGVAADPNVLPFGSAWKWSYPTDGHADGWQADGFDDSAWSVGVGEFGFGENDEATVISAAPTPRPITSYFRTTVDIADPTAWTAIRASVLRDDAAVVYVNGVEVGRANLPAGPITPGTKAVTGLTSRADELALYEIDIPASAFRAGSNTIAVGIHQNDRWSGDASFDLRLVGQP